MGGNYDFSVLMITYNHENFIEQAVQSVLKQNFAGRLQLIIGVDKSNDRTLEICQRLREECPEIIHLLEHKESAGMFRNFYSTLKKCTGKYIAILEGDDYWTDDNKLADQYEYFETHPNCILTAGMVEVVDENSKRVSTPVVAKKGEILLKEDVISINQLNTLTTAFRKEALDFSEVEKLKASPHLDWSFYLSLQYPENGYIYRFNRIFGAYRQHAGGVYSQIGDEKRNENILKTIYSIYNLDIEPSYKNYLKALYTNYTLRLKSKNILNEDPYASFFDANLMIYNANGSVTMGYIKSLYRSAFSFLTDSRNQTSFRLKWELFRQTRLSRKNYFNIFLLPLSPALLLLKQKEKSIKSQYQ